MFVYVVQLLVTRATQAWLLCLVQWDTGMQHHCCVVVYWMCCCVLDVLVRLLQLVVGKARATKHAMPGTLRGTPAQVQRREVLDPEKSTA